MSIRRLIFVLSSVGLVVACSEEVSPLEQICKDEIARKVAETDVEIDSYQITGFSKDGDGNTVVAGKAELTIGVTKKSGPFSCVMQGEGKDASVIRADLIYD